MGLTRFHSIKEFVNQKPFLNQKFFFSSHLPHRELNFPNNRYGDIKRFIFYSKTTVSKMKTSDKAKMGLIQAVGYQVPLRKTENLWTWERTWKLLSIVRADGCHRSTFVTKKKTCNIIKTIELTIHQHCWKRSEINHKRDLKIPRNRCTVRVA